MAEVQDEDQWLYGDDKDENTTDGKGPTPEPDPAVSGTQPSNQDETNVNQKAPIETAETNGEVNDSSAEKSKEGEPEDTQETEENGEKAKTDGEDDSSSDDEPTVTIGKIVKQPDIMRPPPPTHRAVPTSGLKDDDFNSVGKINGVAATDYNLAELEEKPWRKPGADLSDYFNYGFTEDTWIKYCERQKAMRTNESGIGLIGLGINIGKSMLGSSNIPVSIVNENSKYGGIRKPAGVPLIKAKDDEGLGGGNQNPSVNTIQVMTADRRTYSNKVLAGSGGGLNNYDDMDFGGNPYGDFFSTPPPPNFFTPPPPAAPWGGMTNIPPPGWNPSGVHQAPPPPVSHHRGIGYFDEDSMGGSLGSAPSRSSKEEREREVEKIRDIPEPRLSRERESRHHSSRRRSRSRSKSRHHRRSRSRSRSRSPSHRHKRKKSKRERETD